MVLKNIYIARHGYRANWLPPPHPENPTGIDSDTPLAAHGEEQAKELAHYILSINPHPQIIFSSPFYRCLQTSDPIAEVLEIPLEIENGIGEWYKPDRPTIPIPASAEQLTEFFPRLQTDWTATVQPSPKGETPEDIFKRCQDFITKFIPKFESTYKDVETILFVTHAATKIALGMSLLGFDSVYDTLDDEDTRLRAGSCSLDKYERDLDTSSWKITMNGNVEFLTNGEEMHWDFLNGFEAGSDEDIKNREKFAAQQASNSKDNEEYEDVYVTLEIPSNTFNNSTIPPTAKLQTSGLHTKAPLFKIDNEFYQGEWQKLVGTEVAITDDISQVLKVTDRIKLEDLTLQ